MFAAKPYTRSRALAAMAVAIATDVAQFFMGPLGWAFADQISDLIAMALTVKLLGFHPLLLPTFVVEFIPVVDMLPSWTACVGSLLILRKRNPPAPPPTSPAPPVLPPG